MARPYAAPSLSTRRRSDADIRTVAWLVSTAVLLAAAWWLLAPSVLGGGTTFVTVDGTSMLPTLHRDDLVVLRRSSSYQIGDAVGYRSTLLQRVVLHRIVAIQNGRYTFKGDNNGFLDPEHPRREHLVGRMWVRVPSAGRLVSLLHVPWIAGGLAAMLVLFLGLDRPPAPSEEREQDPGLDHGPAS